VTQPTPDQDAKRPKMPGRRVPGELGWKLDEQGNEVSVTVEPGLPLRLLSIVPFLLVSVTGIVALIGWLVIVVVGGGVREPIWTWIARTPARDAVPQVALAVGLGIAVLGILLLSMWAAMHGFARSAGRLFWRVAEAVFSLAAVVLLIATVTKPGILADLGLSNSDWFFVFGLLGYSLVVCRLRERRSESVSEEEARE